MKRAIIAVAAIILNASAHAQDFELPLSHSAASADGVIRITTYLRVPGPPADEASNIDKSLEVRRTLYATAVRECATLTETFTAQCELSSLTVSRVRYGKGSDKGEVSATATYHLRKARTARKR